MLSKIRSNSNLAVLVLAVGFFLTYASLSVASHNNFNSAAYDLGIFDQAVWQLSHFQIPFSSLRGVNLMGDHFSPILFLISPLYWIWSDPRILLLVQAFSVSFSAIPLVLVAQSVWKVRPSIGNLVYPLFALMYLLFIGLQNAVGFDFHPETMMLLPLSCLFYALHFERKRFFWLILPCVLMTKEEMPLVMILLGVYVLTIKKLRRQGVLIVLISLLYFILVSFWLMPHLNVAGNAGGYIDFYNLGKTPLEMVQTALIHPLTVLKELVTPSQKLETFTILLGSFLFLPLLSSFTWLLSLPIILARFLSVTSVRWGLEFHYWVSIAPILAMGTIYGLDRLLRSRQRREQLILIFLLGMGLMNIFIHYSQRPYLSQAVSKITSQNSLSRLELMSMVAQVPKDASLSAQSSLVPHLSQRKEIYLYPYGKAEVDYVILTLERTTYPLLFPDMEKEIRLLLADPDVSLVRQQGNTYLFRRIH